MKKLAKILLILFVLTLAIPCFVACREKAYNLDTLKYYLLDDGTYEVGIGEDRDLSEIVIPSRHRGRSVTKIEDDAFSYCSSLTSITIPNTVTSIGDNAFMGCSSLTSITIHNNVTSIGYGAFSYCSSLTSIKIPNSVSSIDGNAFAYCSALIIYCEAESEPSGWYDWNSSDRPVVWDYKNNEVADDGCIYTVIGGLYFSLKDGDAVVINQPSKITTANIPSSVTYKGNTYVVTSIDVYAFSSSPLLTSITIPDSVTSIGEYAFSYCDSLTSITIPNSVTSIGDSAFRNCSSLTIYCEAKSQPSGWPNNWNEFDWGGNYCPVVWGYEE